MKHATRLKRLINNMVPVKVRLAHATAPAVLRSLPPADTTTIKPTVKKWLDILIAQDQRRARRLANR